MNQFNTCVRRVINCLCGSALFWPADLHHVLLPVWPLHFYLKPRLKSDLCPNQLIPFIHSVTTTWEQLSPEKILPSTQGNKISESSLVPHPPFHPDSEFITQFCQFYLPELSRTSLPPAPLPPSSPISPARTTAVASKQSLKFKLPSNLSCSQRLTFLMK